MQVSRLNSSLAIFYQFFSHVLEIPWSDCTHLHIRRPYCPRYEPIIFILLITSGLQPKMHKYRKF